VHSTPTPTLLSPSLSRALSHPSMSRAQPCPCAHHPSSSSSSSRAHRHRAHHHHHRVLPLRRGVPCRRHPRRAVPIRSFDWVTRCDDGNITVTQNVPGLSPSVARILDTSTLTDARLTDDGVGVRTHDDDVARREYETETKSSRDKGTTRTMRCDAHAFSLAEGNGV